MGNINLAIDKKIEELIEKADVAQKSGNYEAEKEYDRQIKILQEEKLKLLKTIYEAKVEEKPKTL